MQLSLVSELIDANNREWKREVVLNTFCKEDADRILSILLAQEAHEDQLVWQGEPSGEFLVHSAYKILQSNHMVPSAYALQKLFYRHLWGLDLPNKIKIIIWRISWSYLPTFVNLNYRRISNTKVCRR